MSANDKQVGGTHYQGAVQHWDIAALAYGEAHFKCTATKYISRWRKKNGVQDLEKAKHYLEKLLELNPKAYLGAAPYNACQAVLTTDWVAEDKVLIVKILTALGPGHLQECVSIIDALIAGQTSNPAA